MEEKMKPDKSTAEEVEFERDFDKLRTVTGAKRKKIETILADARKNRSISLRISTFDLAKLKEKASIQGIPYQTLINSVLHRYLTNELLDRGEAIKSFQLK
jgi:predicted DNA binding CopG/RHH family protein